MDLIKNRKCEEITPGAQHGVTAKCLDNFAVNFTHCCLLKVLKTDNWRTAWVW